jgi:hypothetical protein
MYQTLRQVFTEGTRPMHKAYAQGLYTGPMPCVIFTFYLLPLVSPFGCASSKKVTKNNQMCLNKKKLLKDAQPAGVNNNFFQYCCNN